MIEKRINSLRTKRLSLTLINSSDLNDVITNIDLDIIKNIGGGAPWPYTERDAIDFINICQNAAQKGLCYDYVIRNKESRKFIGLVSLHAAIYGNCERPGQIGYWISKNQRQNGYAFEALHAILRVASSIGLKMIWASCRYDNIASLSLLKKLGMHFIRENVDTYLGEKVKEYIYEMEIPEFFRSESEQMN